MFKIIFVDPNPIDNIAFYWKKLITFYEKRIGQKKNKKEPIRVQNRRKFFEYRLKDFSGRDL